MVLNDPLANVLSKIQNAVKIGKNEVTILPVSKFICTVLDVLKSNGYVKEYELVKDNRGNSVIVRGFELVNKCGAIKPRFSFNKTEAITYEQHYLPAKDFGVVIVSTSKGLMTIQQAREQNLGGKLVAYCY